MGNSKTSYTPIELDDGYLKSINIGGKKWFYSSAEDYEYIGNFIVKATNSHDELLAALKDFMEIAARAKPNCGPKLRQMIQEAQVKHRDILLKAE